MSETHPQRPEQARPARARARPPRGRGRARRGRRSDEARDARRRGVGRTDPLQGRNWVLRTPNRRPGERLVAGEHGTVYGELVDDDGKAVGEFFGSRMAVQSRLGGPTDANGSLEHHTFRLEGGTLLGVGSVLDGESVFAITGGTGRYAGSRGTTSPTSVCSSWAATAPRSSPST